MSVDRWICESCSTRSTVIVHPNDEMCPEFDAGFAQYKRGLKIPKDAATAFTDGWWQAHDSGEKFGKYNSFLEAS